MRWGLPTHEVHMEVELDVGGRPRRLAGHATVPISHEGNHRRELEDIVSALAHASRQAEDLIREELGLPTRAQDAKRAMLEAARRRGHALFYETWEPRRSDLQMCAEAWDNDPPILGEVLG
ncbi:hypothetical protein SEA_UPYO_41 [Gordonia phage Upyo]|nr:hypothetical protein SEA_UPYO_41 [Gordonia phage Upyo]